MHRVPVVIAVTISAFACNPASTQSRDESQTVQMKEQAVEELEEPSRRERPTRPEPAEPIPSEELAVEMFELGPERPVRTSDGFEIHMLSGSPDWTFEFRKNEQVATQQHTGDSLYLEGVAFGELYVISEADNGAQVMLRSDAPTQPLSAESAMQIARREKEVRLGCEGAREETAVNPNGTAVLRVLADDGSEACRIVVGRYTGEIVD